MPTFRIAIYGVDTGDLVTTNNYSEAYRTAIKIHPLTNKDEIVVTEVKPAVSDHNSEHTSNEA